MSVPVNPVVHFRDEKEKLEEILEDLKESLKLLDDMQIKSQAIENMASSLNQTLSVIKNFKRNVYDLMFIQYNEELTTGNNSLEIESHWNPIFENVLKENEERYQTFVKESEELMQRFATLKNEIQHSKSTHYAQPKGLVFGYDSKDSKNSKKEIKDQKALALEHDDSMPPLEANEDEEDNKPKLG